MRSRHSGDLSVIDGVAVLVGVVVGVGIFGFRPWSPSMPTAGRCISPSGWPEAR